MKAITGFQEFIREQGVVALAVGFILGGAVTKLVSSLVEDIINPILAPIMGVETGLQVAILNIGPIQIRWGNFISTLIDFAIIAAVVYFGVKGLGLEKLDKKKGKT